MTDIYFDYHRKVEEFLSTLPKLTEQDLAALDLIGIYTLNCGRTFLGTMSKDVDRCLLSNMYHAFPCFIGR